MKILNLYAGLGGNRKFWDGHEITAVEHNPQIAAYYEEQYPGDRVIVADAHDYLLHHADDFDFVWSSPPCQSHSRMIKSGRNRKPRYPDLRLYEEIIHLQRHHAGEWLVENVVPWYDPLVTPDHVIGRHLFWTTVFMFGIQEPEPPGKFIDQYDAKQLASWLGLPYDNNIYYEGNHCPVQVLRNCVHPAIGQQVMERLC